MAVFINSKTKEVITEIYESRERFNKTGIWERHEDQEVALDS
jgi:hypothetical protein